MNPDVIFFRSSVIRQLGVYIRDGHKICLMVRAGDVVIELPVSEEDCLGLSAALANAAERVQVTEKATTRFVTLEVPNAGPVPTKR